MSKPIITFLLLIIGLAQANAQKDGIDFLRWKRCHTSFLDGELLMAHPYVLNFDSCKRVFITFNENPLSGENNKFLLNSFKNGYLKIFLVGDDHDTVLVEKRYLKFQMPTLDVTFKGKLPGATFSRDKLKFGSFTAGLLNSEVSYSFPYEEMLVSFRKDGNIKKVQLKENHISAELAEEIAQSGSDILIFDITMKFGYQKVKLQPALYYLE